MQSWVAKVILLVRKNSGNITKEYLQLLTKGNLTPEAYAVMNFSSNKDLPAKQMLNCVHNTAAKQSESDTHNAKRCHSDLASTYDELSDKGLLNKKMGVEQCISVSQNDAVYCDTKSKATANPCIPVSISGEKSEADACPTSDECCTSEARWLSDNQSQNTSSGYSSSDSNLSQQSDVSASECMPGKRKKWHSQERRTRERKLIRDFPDWLAYDGKKNWYAFKQKFLSYAKLLELTPQERLNCLRWSLTDKAAEFSALGSETTSYDQLLNKLERRFGDTELQADALVKFQKSTQCAGEELEDWADRVQMLAAKAFKGLPETYANNQIVMQFCQGLTDKETAYQVSLKEPKNIDDAIHGVRWCQHVRKAIFGKKRSEDRFIEKPGGQSSKDHEVSSIDKDFGHMDMTEKDSSSEGSTHCGSKDRSSQVTKGSEPEIVTVRQLRSVSQFTMAIQVGNRPVKAVVDSAAEVTIVSDKVYETLKHPPKKLREVTLQTAGRQMALRGFIVGPVRMNIGTRWYSEKVYVAPIEQEMLLGFDILFHRGKCILDMAKGTLNFDDEEIHLDLGRRPVQKSAAMTCTANHLLNPNSYRQNNKGPEGKLTSYQGCFVCGNLSHFARDCEKRATVGQSG